MIAWPGPIPEPWGDLYKNPPRPGRFALWRARRRAYRAPAERLILAVARFGFEVKVIRWEGVDVAIDWHWPSWLWTWTGESDPNFRRWSADLRAAVPFGSGAVTVRCWDDATGEWYGKAPGDWRFLDVGRYIEGAENAACWLREREAAEIAEREARRAAERTA